MGPSGNGSSQVEIASPVNSASGDKVVIACAGDEASYLHGSISRERAESKRGTPSSTPAFQQLYNVSFPLRAPFPPKAR